MATSLSELFVQLTRKNDQITYPVFANREDLRELATKFVGERLGVVSDEFLEVVDERKLNLRRLVGFDGVCRLCSTGSHRRNMCRGC